MRRRFVYLAILACSLYFGSLFIQSSWAKPVAATQAATEFKEVLVGFCVNNQVGSKWSIVAVSGELPQHSVGLLSSPRLNLKQGDCLTARLQLSSFQGFSRFAYRASLKEVIVEITHAPQLAALNEMRVYAGSFKGDSANLVSGLAIGVDQGLTKQFLTNMRLTGLTHLTAVSGANCAIVIGAFWLLGRLLRLGRNLRVLSSLVALVGYVELVGPQPSVLRAAFMMSVILVSLEFGRKVWIPAALGIGSATLLIVDPWLVSDYGFWLSVLATFGLVLLTPTLSAKFEMSMPKPLAMGLSVTIAAQLWCLPLLATLQGGFTIYSILANLLVEPMVPFITVLGFLATVAGPWLPALGNLLMWFASFPAGWIVYVANSLSQAPSGLLNLPGGTFGFIAISVFVLCVSIALVHRKFLPLVLSSGIALIWFGSQLTSLGHQLSWPARNWSVVSCDVGQGDALVVRSKEKIAVIDVGKDNELIDQCLDRLHIDRVNLLVLTHFDNDHVGGLAGLERGRIVDEILISQFPDERMKFVSGARQAGLGLTGSLGEFSWQVFSSLGEAASSANEGSLGIRFESPEMVIYTMADLNKVAQTRALSWVFDSAKPTIVKVSHHGSADQDPEFYRRIGADVALVSVGVGNSYGHPTSKILSTLKDNGVTVFRTDRQGSISLSVQGGLIEARVTGAG